MTTALIVGGGPVGLSIALRLAQLGVPAVLVERHHDCATFPKGRALSIRSMEIYRSWGLEDAITAAGLSRDNLAFYTGTTLTAEHHTRFATNPAARPPVPSPTYTLLCSQDRLEPLLRDHAEQLAPGRIRFGVELTRFTTDHAGITANLYDHTTGSTETLHADYLIGADGARSPIREHLGIPMTGPRDTSHNLNILFEADLAPHVADRLSTVYTITASGLHGAFLTVDSQRRWLFNLVADGTDPGLADYDDTTCIQLIRTAAGLPDLAVTLLDRQVWQAGAQVADRFRDGRVLLAGDAAHITTPYGGFGMNCGIADADNLTWKLAAVHHRWATPALLATYEAERRPVALASAAESHQRLLDAITEHRTGAPPRPRPSEGLVLGYAYTSTAVIPDGTAPPGGDPVAEYHPVARPGHRLPHLWLGDGKQRSTLDLIGTGLTVLAGPSAAAAPVVEEFHRRGAPTELHTLTDESCPGFLDTFGITASGFVVVRPDGHVAWRHPHGHAAPASAITQLLGSTS